MDIHRGAHRSFWQVMKHRGEEGCADKLKFRLRALRDTNRYRETSLFSVNALPFSSISE